MSFEITQEIDVDLIETGLETVYVSQNDNKGRIIQCNLLLSGEKWVIPNGVKVAIRITKGNQKSIYKEIGKDNFGSYSNNIVKFPVLSSMTRIYGRVECTLEFFQEEVMIHSVMFYLNVGKIAFDDETLEDTNEYTMLIDHVKKAEAYANLSESYAVGTDNTVRENDSIDNSKYYYQKSKESQEAANLSEINAKKSASSASISEQNSKISEQNSKISEQNAKESENNSKKYEENNKLIYEVMKNLEHKVVLSSEEPDNLNINDEWLCYYENPDANIVTSSIDIISDIEPVYYKNQFNDINISSYEEVIWE